MAIDGYTESQYEQLVREVGNDLKLTHGPKRRHDDSSYEVCMMHPADGRLRTNFFEKDVSDHSEESPSEQVKKRRRRGKRVHLLKPGPKSGQSGRSHSVCSLMMNDLTFV